MTKSVGRRSRPRRQHYLPEFHLRRFATGARREVCVFDKQWAKYARRPAATSAVVRDYYLVPGATDEERLMLEREFARLENVVAPVIARLDATYRGTASLDEHERQDLAAYIAILHVRVPAYRDDAFRRAQELTTDLDALGLADPVDFLAAAREHGMSGTDAELELLRRRAAEGIATGAMRIVLAPTVSLGGLEPATRRGVPLFVAREWELLRAGPEHGFVIGDQPVGLLSHGSLSPSIGFASPDVHVFVPLSARTLLLISDRPRTPRPLAVKYDLGGAFDEPWWATANKVAWLTAQRYVWGGRMADLRATELLIPPEFRRRDLRDLDEEQERHRKVIAMERRLARQAARRNVRVGTDGPT